METKNMITSLPVLERIEQAQRETPICACGAATAPVGRPDGVWLACTCESQAHPMLRRLLSFDLVMGHTNRRIIDQSR
jgi:hypothetical protein